MGFRLHGRMYHSSRGIALIVRGPAVLGQSRQCLGSCDTFTLLPLSAAQMRAIIFHVSFSHDNHLETYNIVQTWGDPSGKPILGLHGWLDNAGTHDHLAPLLNEVTCHLMIDCDMIMCLQGYYLVSLDQPGHGRSSQYPAGMQYKMSDGFVFLR